MSQFGPLRVNLDFHVKTNLLVARLDDEIEYLTQGWHRTAVHRLLLRITLRIFTRRVQASDIVGLCRFKRHRMDAGAALLQPGSIGITRDFGFETGVVYHHDLEITGYGKIQFKRADPDGERPGKSGQRILGHQTTRASMPLQVKSLGNAGQSG